ncbi:MAG TPA: hypothetical protein DCP92_24725 [Nitrospiraceae bacterium]|jgi:hypothetical protein|nr:hypothetical protein [Nitrospiraceae bacterium]
MAKTKRANSPSRQPWLAYGGGRIATGNESGLVPGEHMGMGYYYGRGKRNAMGEMRSDSIGYRPVSKKQLGTPPTTVV